MRHLLLFLLVCPLFVLAQQPQPPSYYGGFPYKTLDLREGAEGSVRVRPVEDFKKFISRSRPTVPLKRKCSTLEIEKDRQAKNGSETLDSFEDWLQSGIQQDRGMRRRSIGESETLSLPVVIHVIYSNPVENVSEKQIMSQMRVLNEDYRRRNPDATQTEASFQRVAADVGIEFCLAKIDPQGNPTSGIERISLGGSPFSDRYINDVIKPTTIWDPKRYMNLWVCNIAGGILGFAQFPSSSGLTGIPNDPGAENTDGVVMHYSAFGTTGTASAPFNKGRTATHEIGHWLGLRHVWGDGPCDVDDYCKDTPVTAGATYNCPSGIQGCFGAAMFQNYMDYTNDGCMNLFTLDQRTRMRRVLQNSPRRMELLESDVCQMNTEPPVANFKADIQLGGAPLLVNFTDLSEGDVVSYSWKFPGGEPAASTLESPSVTYSQPGLYTILLTVKNTANLTDSKQQEAYIWVADRGVALPFNLNFETDKIPPAGTLIYDPYEEGTWEHTTRTGGHGSSTGALFFNNYYHKFKGDADWLLTRYLDFSTSSSPILKFDVAYAKFSGDYSDTLGVFISTGGKTEFQAVYFRGGDDLKTAEDYFKPFAPFPEDWRTETIDLSAFVGEDLVQIAFVNLSGYGNDIYVDNVFIGNQPKTVPKPAFNVDFREICSGDEVQFGNLTSGENNRYRWSFPGATPTTDTMENPTAQYLKPGTYEVTLTVANESGSNSTTKKQFIVVNPAPVISLDKKIYNLCPGQSVKLETSGSDQYSWYNADESEELSPTRSLSVSPQSNSAYTLLAENDYGCDATQKAEVRVQDVENIAISPGEASVCKGQGVILRAEGNATFRWSPGSSLSLESGPTVTATPSSTTTYRLTATTPGGCVVIREAKVIVSETPTVYVAAEKQEICAGERVRIRAAGSGPFNWTANKLPTDLASDIISVEPSETTTYEVTAGGAGCQSKAQVTIQVKPQSTMLAEKESYVVCPEGQTNIAITGAARVQWQQRPGFLRAEGLAASVAPASSQTYRAIATAANGCRDTIDVPVSIAKANEVKIINSSPTLCQGMYSELRASGASSYRWSPQVGLSRTTGATVIARPATSTTYYLTATDENGCISRARTTVSVGSSSSPRADFDADQNRICAGGSVQFSDRSQFATSFEWEFPGAIPERSNEQNPSILYDRAGTYSVRLRVRGCVGNDFTEKRAFITVGEPAGIALNRRLIDACKGDSIMLQASGGSQYTWAPDRGLNTTSAASVIATPKTDVNYTVTGIDRNGCEASSTVQITVKGSGKKVKITSFATAICAGEVAKLSAAGADRYAWFDEEGNSLGQGAELSFRPEKDTRITVEGRTDVGCSSSAGTTVSVKPAPKVTIAPDKINTCAGDPIILTAEGALSYRWEPATGMRIQGNQAFVSPLQDRTFRVTGDDGMGCQTEASVNIDVKNGKELMIRSFDTLLCPGDFTVLTALGGTNYSWSPASGLDSTGGSVVVASPGKTTTYLVKSASAEGCPAIATITVVVYETSNLRVFPPVVNRCAGDTVTLKATGANDIQWAAGPGLRPSQDPEVIIRPDQTATYRAFGIDDNGCEVEGVTTVNMRKAEGVELQASMSSVCLGESIELEAKGGINFQWLESPGMETPRGAKATVIPMENTTYSVIVSDSLGCSDTASIELTVQQLEADFVMSTSSIDLATQEGLVTVQDKTAGATEWLWDFGDGGEATTPSAKHFYDQPGEYEVVMVVTDGVCIDEISSKVRVINTSSLAELEDADALAISPTSSPDGRVDLLIDSERPMRLRYRVLDGFGTAVLTDYIRFEGKAYRQTLDLSSFGKGNYIIQVTDGEETWDQQVQVN